MDVEGFVWQQMEHCIFRCVVPFGATHFFAIQKEVWIMKKGISLVLALVICLPLCACGKSKAAVEFVKLIKGS